jgi:hypothetical protein
MMDKSIFSAIVLVIYGYAFARVDVFFASLIFLLYKTFKYFGQKARTTKDELLPDDRPDGWFF